MPALSDEDVIEILETEGFRQLEIAYDPHKEVVMGRRVRLLDRNWPLTLRVHTGIFRDPETDDERKLHAILGNGPIHLYYDLGHIRMVLVWRAPRGSILPIAGYDRIKLAGVNAEAELREALRTWMDHAPPACHECGSPMRKRKPKYRTDWEWSCSICDAAAPIEHPAAG